MPRAALRASIAFLFLAGAYTGCRSTLTLDWAGDGAAPLFAVSAQPGRGNVTFRFSADAASTMVLYVATNASFTGATRIEGAASPFVIASGTSAATWHARVAILAGAEESAPSPAVSASEHALLARTPSWSSDGGPPGARFGYPTVGIGDVNGDGFDDFGVGAYDWNDDDLDDAGRVFVWYGSPLGASSAADWTFGGELANTSLGAGLGGAGDVNDDGYDDLLVGAPDYGSSPELNGEGKLYLFLGGPDGLPALPTQTEVGGVATTYLGRHVGPAGDTDGDGLDDIIVGAPGFDNAVQAAGIAFVELGTATGVGPGIDYDVQGVDAFDSYGWAIGPKAGDADGDGFGDILFGAEGAEGTQPEEGIFNVFYGSAIGISGAGTQSGESNQAGARTGSMVCWSDLNGDGFSDALVASNLHDGVNGADTGRVEVLFGSVAGLIERAVVIIEGTQAGERFGEGVGAADLDGDGADELLVGASNHDGTIGAVRVYASVAPGELASLTWEWEGSTAGEYAGGFVGGAGDVNGDGREELLVGTMGRSTIVPTAPRASLFYGLPVAGPLVDAGSPIVVSDGLTASLSTAVIASPGGAAILDCTIDWGDGSSTDVPSCTQAAVRAAVHTWSAAADYVVRLSASDATGLTSSAFTHVRVVE